MTYKLILLSTILAASLLLVGTTAHAQIIIIPDCNEEPQDPFCQGQCEFVEPLPPWCEQPEPERDPIIIIPGITVSQNKKLLYKDEQSDKWKFAFGFNVYKGLIKKLEAAGYKEGEDLFVAHYDWRQPASHNAASYLIPAIQQAKQTTGADKVDVIGHSFGGIISRAYIQGESYDNDIDQLITLGSPHQGAADAYVAWEGGIYPEGWDLFIRNRVDKVENALKKHHNQENLQRPESFRTFFPSLRDMLPINDFTRKDDQLMPVGSLTEQNLFLQNLNTTYDTIADKGVELSTIASTQVETLDKVTLASERSILDILLNRWRDGHANPDPPPLDSTAGDARVLLSSAHLGSSNITLNSVQHHKLPEGAQEKVLETLGLEEAPEHFEFELPKSILGITILSPVDATIEGPNGKILSKDQNDFGSELAEYDDDPNDPNDPKDITILDPPEGDYDVTLTGTDNGDYTAITTYADEDETTSTTSEGVTSPGQTDTTSFTLANETFVADVDLVALTKELQQTIRTLFKAKHLKPPAFGPLYASATLLHVNAKIHQRLAEKLGDDHKHTQRALDRLQRAFDRFSDLLDQQIAKGRLDETAVAQLLPLRDQIQAGL